MSLPLIVSHILLWIVVLLLVAVMLATVRQVGLIHRRIPPVGARMGQPGPRIGDEAPDFDARDLAGRRRTLASTRGRKTLLVFVSGRCSTCRDLAPALRSVAKSERSALDMILISDEPRQSVEQFVRESGLGDIPTIASHELPALYQVFTTPYGVLIDDLGRVVAKGILNSLEHVESLVRAGELGVDSVETLLDQQANEDRASFGDGSRAGGGHVG